MPSRFICANVVAAVLACAVAAVLPPALAAGPTLAEPDLAPGTPSCTTSGLVVWLDTHGSGAAGSVDYTLELTNLSGHVCTLIGYPRIAAVNLRGRQLGRGSGRYVSRKPLVVLANGASASVALEIINVANFPAAACRPVTAAGLRVFPPHHTASKVVPFPFRACSRSGPEYLWAQAVQAQQ